MCDREESIIAFVDKHFHNKVDKDVYLFVKELYEYINFLYDGTVNSEDLTSESSDEDTINEVIEEEKIKVKIDSEGFHSLQ